jgi:hypothetical protein
MGMIQLRSNGEGHFEERVLKTLDAFANLVVLSVNSQQGVKLQFRTIEQDGVAVRVLDGQSFLLPGLRPAFAQKGAYLVFASSPDAIRNFRPPASGELPPASAEVPLVRLAMAGWANYLRAHRAPLADFAARANHLELAEVNRRLDRLMETLELFNTLELTLRTDPNRATITLRLRAAAPLQSP